MAQFRTVGLIGRPGSRYTDETLRRLLRFLLARGHRVVLEEGVEYIDAAADEAVPNQHIMRAGLATLGANCDLAIVVGGDGSMLGAARSLCTSGTPVVGVNQGRVGFLTDISPDDMELKLAELLSGHFELEERFLLDSTVEREGVSVARAHALNDVVVHPGQVARMIEFDLYIDDLFVYRQRSDGIIIATPTGSTAYALSAGGPILHPKLDAVVLVPMFPHTLSSRPLVVPADSEIRLHVCGKLDQQPLLSCDGQTQLLTHAGDVLRIRRKPERLKLLHPLGHSYYESCRSKLGWSNNGQ
ncbi:NAD(+) kinase [Halotalea alkalilenta]|uniref:NAD kinase n=1 Tax=Halotalea alkalilenta TaxID=376489 RepID=A0A172YGE9_9GAMM|nr:NAD(+) kinase [Halotalea alkalilenta]ANF58287.1 NAD(+) kinase [Halotalea alkalilenta]